MNEVPETTKKQKKTNQYVKTFRCGAVATNIFRRQAPGGFEYLDFGVSRSWKSSSAMTKAAMSAELMVFPPLGDTI